MIQDIELNMDSQVGLCQQFLSKEMHVVFYQCIGFTGFFDQRRVLLFINLYCHFLFQSCPSDELYSLDSDYFLSSLEDISAQI